MLVRCSTPSIVAEIGMSQEESTPKRLALVEIHHQSDLDLHPSGQGYLSGTRSEGEVNMTRTARQPHEWLTLGAGLVAACMWASPWAARHRHGQRPVRQSSVRMRAALVLVGFALGSVTWIVTARNARSGHPPPR